MARRIALLVGAVASVVVALSLLLSYLTLRGVSRTGFELFTRADVLVVVGSLLAAGLLAAAALTRNQVLAPLGLAAAAMTFGALLFTGLELVHQLTREVGALGFGFSPGRALDAELAEGAVLGMVASLTATIAALAALLLPEEAPAAVARLEAAPGERASERATQLPPVPTPSPTQVRPRAEPPAAEAPAATPAGWYDDPGGSGRRRYWDGERWTEHLEG